MTLEERIDAFDQLGSLIKNISEEDLDNLCRRVENQNNWFSPAQTKNALNALLVFLKKESLENWLSAYNLPSDNDPKSVGVLMAGNIPAVGFHDLMCVLLTGHRACIKLSSSDQVLILWLIEKLVSIQPKFKSMISVEEMLKNKDAYIATGSDNSARYFEYYFGKYPNIIRKNRTSVGILDGGESKEDYIKLGLDIFQYYGLGCRNVSKIFVPNREVLISFMDSIEDYSEIANNHKYFHNYEYNKSILLVNKEDHLDNGFLILQESKGLVSPISVLYYEVYQTIEELNDLVRRVSDKIQCKLSRGGWFEDSLDFGQAQCPTLVDYADGIDTIAFLKTL
ncbi:acyl-CoA reductase [Cognataquiflexum rubidum]|uniref:acyl-CoA reductase n=1 Tax=Cognataquiflexum rubidum TaxID=2922273 RepID=UPI001F138871|nr:acyl-CoA reductase [Cognataquiflexum rubidum]MCH6235448.1 acyl-CoA reductase [Cognataquiflexum rubidum]